VAYLADTNVLLRWAQPLHPDYSLARSAIEALRQRGEELYITAQNVVEFWNAATRPVDRNGFGLTPAQVDLEVGQLDRFFLFASDSADVYPEWRRLVATLGVSGVQVHDARLAAVMRVHGIAHLLTFNHADFSRYPGITAVRPQDVPTGP